MIQFIKEALREFKHVVWPTRKETQKFFGLVLAILVFFGVYLFIASNIFSEIIFGLKNILGSGDRSSSISRSVSQDEIDALFSNEVNVEVSDVQASSEQAVVEATATWEVSE